MIRRKPFFCFSAELIDAMQVEPLTQLTRPFKCMLLLEALVCKRIQSGYSLQASCLLCLLRSILVYSLAVQLQCYIAKRETEISSHYYPYKCSQEDCHLLKS